MRFLAALLLFCTSASGQEFDWSFGDSFSWSITEKGGGPSVSDKDVADSSAGQVSETPALESFVHRVTVGNSGGSATCIAPGVFVTCKHVFDGAPNYNVSIDGEPAVAASVTLSKSYDVAIVRLGSEAAAVPFSVDEPEYMAECVAFGFGSETVHRGVISNDDTLSLYAGEGTIEQGDSGGAVFCNGVLVGVIRGKNPNNGKVCYFTPLKSVAALVAPFSPDAAVPAAPGADNEAVQKPAITINLADFPCPPCETLKGYDWGEFAVTWETGGAESYPQISWTDKRGVKRVLTGAYMPSRVMWSFRETMK